MYLSPQHVGKLLVCVYTTITFKGGENLSIELFCEEFDFTREEAEILRRLHEAEE